MIFNAPCIDGASGMAAADCGSRGRTLMEGGHERNAASDVDQGCWERIRNVSQLHALCPEGEPQASLRTVPARMLLSRDIIAADGRR
jgi:hypothetical protein